MCVSMLFVFLNQMGAVGGGGGGGLCVYVVGAGGVECKYV